MTTRELEQPQEAAEPEELLYYWVDPSRFQIMRRSLEAMLLTRRCRSCKEETVNFAEAPPVKEQIKHIVDCCAQDETFIRPGMPMQEMVFRMLLAGGNHPMSLDGIHYQLTERWATPTNPMTISKESLKRILDSDEFYGFQEVSASEAEGL